MSSVAAVAAVAAACEVSKTNTVRVNLLVKRPYRWRWFGNKGVILVLFWSLSVLAFFDFVFRVHVENPNNPSRYYYFIGVSAAGIFFPVVGWLTDVFIGRYKAVRSSLLALWCGAILWCLLDVLYSKLIISYPTNHYVIICSGIIFVLIPIGCFLVNIVQFCVDQLQDSSSEEIISFILWFVWICNISKLIAKLQICISRGYLNFTYSTLYISVLLTLTVSFDFLFNDWLVKEPVTQNPLRIIFKVLQFAIRNKYPQQLSALAYWDSNRCSRIDLAKSKYGGPCTNGQVEDVKAFFRINSLNFIGSLYFAIPFYCGNFISPILSKFKGFREANCVEQGNDCLKKQLVVQLGYLVIVLCIPAYELLMRPFFWKWIPQVKIFTRLILGSLFVFSHMAGLISVEIVGHYSHTESNATEPYCEFDAKVNSKVNCSSNHEVYWLSLLSVVNAFGQYLILAAGIEYLCAKTPYSMRGLIFGSTFTCLGLSLGLMHLLFIPFRLHVISIFGLTLGCVFWFLVACTGVALLLSALLVVVNICCNRKQENLDAIADDA